MAGLPFAMLPVLRIASTFLIFSMSLNDLNAGESHGSKSPYEIGIGVLGCRHVFGGPWARVFEDERPFV